MTYTMMKVDTKKNYVPSCSFRCLRSKRLDRARASSVLTLDAAEDADKKKYGAAEIHIVRSSGKCLKIWFVGS